MTLQLLLTILKLPLFVVMSFLAWYFPGLLILGKKQLKPEEKVALSYGLGIVFFSSLAAFLGLIRLRFLALPLLLGIAVVVFKKFSLKAIFSPFLFLLKNKILLFLLLAGIIVQGLINFPSGYLYSEGYYFWSSQGHDGLWHVALMQEIARHFPPNNPLYSHQLLTNYHFASDILMGEFYRLFPFFGSLDLYFRFFPVLLSFLIGLGAFCFAQRKWGKTVGYWAVFFTYFCGSFGYLVSIFNHRFPLSGETTFWASQGNTILGNPPHALGIILLTLILFLLEIWRKTKEKFWLFLIVFLGYALAIVKISSGVVMIFALGMTGLWLFWKEKKVGLFLLSVFLAASNFFILKIISPTASSFLLFQPLWFPRTMMVARLGNVEWELKRQHYLWKGTWKSYLHAVQLELEAILIFLVGNSGIRIIGLGEIVKKIRNKIDVVEVFLSSCLVFSVGIVLLFVQKGLIYNFIQFMQIYLHFLGFLAAATLVGILKKLKAKPTKILLSLLVIVLAVPTVLGNFFDFYGPNTSPLAKVSLAEVEALDWLKKNSNPEEIVLTKPFVGGAERLYNRQPWPISAWYSTPYVFVFSHRYAYLAAEEQLMITGYEIEDDLSLMRAFFKQTDLAASKNFLEEKNIKYIYVRKDELEKPLLEEKLGISQVFENDEVLIFKVRE